MRLASDQPPIQFDPSTQYNLVHPQTNHTLAVISSRGVTFESEAHSLQETLSLTGISIPAPKAKEFNDKRVVYLSSKDFPRAFLEVYFPNCLKEQGFRLELNNTIKA